MRYILLLVSCCFNLISQAQDVNTLLKEASNLEIQLKENAALDKYKEVLLTDPNNIKALVKATELNIAIGGREKNKTTIRLFYETAYAFAFRAIKAEAANADANYAMAMASGKMTDVEDENKKIVAFVKDTKLYADKALAIQSNHARANYTLGKWHYEMVNLSGIKKAAVKLLYGGLPNGDIDSATARMEKCRVGEPYFVQNYYDLAMAYKQANNPTKMLEVLNKLVKLPVRTVNDAGLKAAGQKLLDEQQ